MTKAEKRRCDSAYWPTKKRFFLRRILPLLVLLNSPHVFADHASNLVELSLEDLLKVEVSSATGFSQSVEDAPASVSVIGETELRQRGYRNLAEALVTLPGIHSSNDHNYTFLGVRGFNRPSDYGTRILLLTDGARQNDPLYDQALFGNESPIEIDWVKRLEFVAGPASAIYGANALFGTVNAVMLDGGDIDGVRTSLDVGSENTRRLGLVAGKRLPGDREWFFGFAAYRSDGSNFYFPENDNGASDGHARGLDGERYQKAYAKFRWGNWRLSTNVSRREKDLPNAPFGTTFGQSGTRSTDENRLVELRYDGENLDGWQTGIRVYSGKYEYSGDWVFAPAADGRDRAVAEWYGGEYRVTHTGIRGHKLVFGMDAQWNTRVEQRYFEVNPYARVLETDHRTRVHGFFVQDEWRFHPHWLLNIALRRDAHSDFEGITSPRGALIWQPNQRFSLKAMAGSAFRAPNAFERFYNDGNVTQAANPSLKYERIRSVELAAAYRFGQSGRLGASIYRNQVHNLIDQVTDSSGVSSFVNQGDVRARGLELSAENAWAGDYRLRGSLTWQQSHRDDGSVMVDSPKVMGKLAFSVPVGQGWRASGEILGISSRRGLNGAVPGYGIANLSVASRVLPGIGSFMLGIHNLGDRKYFDPAASSLSQRSVVQEGRQIVLRWILAL